MIGKEHHNNFSRFLPFHFLTYSCVKAEMFLSRTFGRVFAGKCWEICCQFYVLCVWSAQEMPHLQVYIVAGSFLAVTPCSTESVL